MGFTVHHILPISAREALKAKISNSGAPLSQSGLLNLEDALGEFLSLEKGKTVLNAAVSKINRVISWKKSSVDSTRSGRIPST